MIAYDEKGNINYSSLERKGTLPESVINQYNYVDMKNDFELVVELLATNILVHSMYKELLRYEITDDLEFKIFTNDKVKDYMITSNMATGYAYISETDTSIITLDREAYDTSIEMCMYLLKRVKLSYDNLNEVESFIIKSLEFDEPPLTDEELIDLLKLYKNGYYLSKKSAFIKMVLQLNIRNVRKMTPEDLLKKLLIEQEKKIISVSNNKKDLI